MSWLQELINTNGNLTESKKQAFLEQCNRQKYLTCPCEGILSTSETYPSGYSSTSANGRGPGCVQDITGMNMVASSDIYNRCLLASACEFVFPEEMKDAPAYRCNKSQGCKYDSVPTFRLPNESESTDCDSWSLDCISPTP